DAVIEANEARPQINEIIGLMESIENLKNLASTALPQVGTELEKNSRSGNKAADSSKKLKDAAKDAAESFEATRYIADRYKEALEALNLELDKQNRATSKYPDYSKQYRNSLQNEIKLLKNKQGLLKDQA